MPVSANLNNLYGSLSSRLDTVGSMSAETIAFWQNIKRANTDYEQNGNHGYYEPNSVYFIKWLEENWGVKLTLLDSGNYDSKFEIISPDKYTMFVLKYSK